MKIVVINDFASVQGGAAQVAVKSAAALALAGYDVTFVYGSGPVAEVLTSSGVKTVGLDQFDLISNPSALNSAKNGLWNRSVEVQVSSLLSQYDQNNTIVHIHSWVKVLSVSVFKVLLSRQFSFVVTLHDYFSACPNGGFYNYKKNEVCTLRPLSAQCILSNCDSRNYVHKMWRVLRQLVYSRAEFPSAVPNFISVSKFSEAILRPYLPDNAHFWLVDNPIDVVKSHPAKPELSKNYTYIGRLSSEKGCRILTQLKSVNMERLQIIGSGDLEPFLKEQLPKATFLGWCTSEQIMTALDDTRALLFTSEWYETQGLVVAEAAARGVPSVVSDVTAASESVHDGATGMLFRSGSAASLDDVLLKLSDDELVEKLGRGSFSKFWSDPPTMDKHVAELISCYSSILCRRVSR